MQYMANGVDKNQCVGQGLNLWHSAYTGVEAMLLTIEPQADVGPVGLA